MDLLNPEGDIIGTIEHLNIHHDDNEDILEDKRRKYTLPFNEDEIVVAIRLNYYSIRDGGESEIKLLFLSRAFYIQEINQMREDFFNAKTKTKSVENIKLLETIWCS